MKISEVSIYKLEATDKDLGINSGHIYNDTEGRGPYYRINGRWYCTYSNVNTSSTSLFGRYREQLHLLDDSSSYDTIAKRLEDNFQDMMPFKGQLELF